ncbi:hypothetical protein [Streptomyces sp. Ac-502]|uniref:hypothetical protein n=1 Tax=Streptomyces sp. Ac-502 TaxID=3342801 RepID=UPI003862A262
MPSLPDPAHVVRQARDSIEELNRLLLDEGMNLSAPVLADAVQALKSLVERLPQALDLSARVLEILAARDAIAMDNGKTPQTEATAAATELRKVSTDAEQLARGLSGPASKMSHMGVR